MGAWLQGLCIFCSAVGTPAPQMPQTSWDIKYRHEDLGHGKHLLRLSVDYYLVQPQADMRRRMETFAQDYAQQTCPVRYAFLDQGSRYMRTEDVTPLAKQFVFRCVGR